MKKFYLLIPLIVLCFACVKQQNANESKITEESNFPSDKMEFTSYSDSATYHIAGRENMPSINISYNITYPTETEKNSLIIKSFISNCIGNKFANEKSVESAVKTAIKENIANYKNEVCGSESEKDIKSEVWMNHSFECENEILYNAHGFISYACATYSYTGGVHGLVTTSYYVYDFYDNEEITLSNIFNEESLPAILTLIKEKLSQWEYADGIDMGSVSVTENFYINDEGICWIYNPYEIAPYALGAIEVKLPFSEIKNYIIEDTPIESIL